MPQDLMLHVLNQHNAPTKKMAYGTAGFRDEWTGLHSTFIRMGILASIRSRSISGDCVGIMITASHNTEKDNGIKIVDTNGGMLSQDWEPIAEEIANISDPEDVLAYINKMCTTLECTDESMPSVVVIGRDTRPHSRELFECVRAGVSAVGGQYFDLGEVTTPQLHFVVHKANVNKQKGISLDTFDPVSALQNYYDTLLQGFRSLQQSSSNDPQCQVVIDGAFGVGALSIRAFIQRQTELYSNSGGPLLSVDIRNNAFDGPVNANCGAETVQKGQRPPCGVESSEVNKLMCSYDGDADRIVFYTFFPTVDNTIKWTLYDGDKIAALIATFLQSELQAAGLLKPCPGSSNKRSMPCTFGVVQTAYANGASGAFLRSKGIDITITKTGVKYLHHAAHKYDVGVYFEANGHGTVLFSERLLVVIASYRADGSEKRKDLAFSRLQACLKVINQAVGDAVSDMLLCMTALQILDISLSSWNDMYSDLPSRQTKVPVTNKDLITCSEDETKVLHPSALQHELDSAMRPVPQGRCFVRPSGTEDFVRVYAEAETQEAADQLALSCIRAINNHVGIVGEMPLSFC